MEAEYWVQLSTHLWKFLLSCMCVQWFAAVYVFTGLEEYSKLPPITACYQNILKLGGTKQSLVGSQSIPAVRQVNQSKKDTSEKSSSDSGSGKRRWSKKRLDDSKDTSGDSDEDSSESRSEKMPKLRRKLRYHLYVNPNSQGQKAESDSDDDDLGNLLKYLDLEETNSTTGFELNILVLRILQDICVWSLNESLTGQLLSQGFLPSLLQCLVSPESEKLADVRTDWAKNARFVIKMHLTRVVLLSCGITAGLQNGVDILKGHRVIEQVFSMALAADNLNYDYSNSKLPSENDFNKQGLFILSDCSIGLLVALTILFQNLPFNPLCIKTALCLVNQFGENNGYKMLEKCIMYADWLKSRSADTTSQCSIFENEPIKVIGTFLTTLKVVRVNYIHHVKCVKRKHQKCLYSHYFDHHHDILGVVKGTKSELSIENTALEAVQASSSYLKQQTSQTVTCLVSSGTRFLLDLLDSAVAKVTRLELLRTIYCSGICCCMNLEHIVSVFVNGMQKFSPAVRTYCADILNKIILEHFSGKACCQTQDFPSVTCLYCDDCSENSTRPDTGTVRLESSIENHMTCLDSGIDSSDLNSEIKQTAINKVSKWNPIAQLKQLLFSDNEELAVSTAKHLMVLSIKGNPFLKAELFFSLYIYALESVKKLEFTEPVLSKSVQVHCLSALPFLLQANCVTKVFLSKQGVSKLCELMEDEVLRGPVLKIFEALVILDEYRFRESQKAMQTECPCPYEGGKVIDSFISELSRRSFSDSSTYCDDSSNSSQCLIRKDCVVLSKFSLPVLVDLWDTCAKLCLHSQVFVSQFRDQQCLLKTESLLIETLDILMSPDLIGQLRSQGSIETEDSGIEGEISLAVEKENQSNFFKRVSLLESLVSVVGACNKSRDLDVSVIIKWLMDFSYYFFKCEYQTRHIIPSISLSIR